MVENNAVQNKRIGLDFSEDYVYGERRIPEGNQTPALVKGEIERCKDYYQSLVRGRVARIAYYDFSEDQSGNLAVPGTKEFAGRARVLDKEPRIGTDFVPGGGNLRFRLRKVKPTISIINTVGYIG